MPPQPQPAPREKVDTNVGDLSGTGLGVADYREATAHGSLPAIDVGKTDPIEREQVIGLLPSTQVQHSHVEISHSKHELEHKTDSHAFGKHGPAHDHHLERHGMPHDIVKIEKDHHLILVKDPHDLHLDRGHGNHHIDIHHMKDHSLEHHGHNHHAHHHPAHHSPHTIHIDLHHSFHHGHFDQTHFERSHHDHHHTHASGSHQLGVVEKHAYLSSETHHHSTESHHHQLVEKAHTPSSHQATPLAEIYDNRDSHHIAVAHPALDTATSKHLQEPSRSSAAGDSLGHSLSHGVAGGKSTLIDQVVHTLAGGLLPRPDLDARHEFDTQFTNQRMHIPLNGLGHEGNHIPLGVQPSRDEHHGASHSAVHGHAPLLDLSSSHRSGVNTHPLEAPSISSDASVHRPIPQHGIDPRPLVHENDPSHLHSAIKHGSDIHSGLHPDTHPHHPQGSHFPASSPTDGAITSPHHARDLLHDGPQHSTPPPPHGGHGSRHEGAGHSPPQSGGPEEVLPPTSGLIPGSTWGISQTFEDIIDLIKAKLFGWSSKERDKEDDEGPKPNKTSVEFPPPETVTSLEGARPVIAGDEGPPSIDPLKGVYSISGRVISKLSRKGLEGVKIYDSQRLFQSTTTDEMGYYKLENYPMGTSYRLSAVKAGYDFTPSAVSGTVDGPTRHDFIAS